MERNTVGEGTASDKMNQNNEQSNVEPYNKSRYRPGTRKLSICKAHGRKKMPNTWLSYLTKTRKMLFEKFNEILTAPETMPELLTERKTKLILKYAETTKPETYRPVTNRPTI